MSHDHADDYDHTDASPDDPRPRVRALQSLLVENGVISTNAVDAAITAYEQDIGPLNGARVVAHAWEDPTFKERLLDDATTALEEFDFEVGVQHIEVVANTDEVHNVVVCTLCSCYPWSLLGLPPTWYKSPEYRSRMVREPRAVLSEFGLTLDDETEVTVWDSSSEVRYMVLPQRPPETDGMSEPELVDIISRNAMLGVARVDTSDAANEEGSTDA